MHVSKIVPAFAIGALVFGGASLAQTAKPDAAAGYPSKPVRWVVPFPPGASNDIIARLIAGKLTDALGHQFVVDNRGGAGGLIGGETVVRAQPDLSRRRNSRHRILLDTNYCDVLLCRRSGGCAEKRRPYSFRQTSFADSRW